MDTPLPVRVVLVDNHPVVRGGLRFFLSTVADIEIVGEADSGAEAVRVCDRVRPDVVVMNMQMPEPDGVTATQRLRRLDPNIRVVALSNSQDGHLVQQALQAGAIGYLTIDLQAHDLIEAIRTVAMGRPALTPAVTRELICAVSQTTPVVSLSRREQDVLMLLTEGLPNNQIAGRLYISQNTVRHHVRSILSKLGAINRTEAVAIAIQHNFIQQPSAIRIEQF